MRLIDADAFIAESIKGRRFIVYKEDVLNCQYVVQTMYHDLAEAINNTPTVDAEIVRHGEWIHRERSCVINEFVCSECGNRKASYKQIHPRGSGMSLADEHGNFYYPPDDKYCSNCGAKMDKKTEE